MNGNGTFAPAQIGLPADQFAAAFPFHFVVDESLRFVQAGRTLQRLCTDVRPGAALGSAFRTIRPAGELTLESVIARKHHFFLLEHVASSLQLRGQFLPVGEGRHIVFLGSPWFTDAAEIAQRGLTFDDFAIHDPVVDLLQVFQASKMALVDSRKLSEKLARQRAEVTAANERLREQERRSRRLALIAARTDNGVVLTDAEGRVEWINAGFTRLTGYTLEDLAGRTPGSVLQGPGTDRAVVQRIREQVRRGEGFRAELLNYGKDGREYWIAVEAQPLFDEEGRLTNFMAIESDVTAQRAEQQRLAVQYEITAALAASDDVAAAIRRTLQVVCERLGWQIGQVWRAGGGRLRLFDSWPPGSPVLGRFVATSRTLAFSRGKGVLGRVWDTGQPVWLTFEAQSTDRLTLLLHEYPRADADPRDAADGARAASEERRSDATRLSMEMGPGQAGEPGHERAFAAAADGVLSGFGFPVLVRGAAWGVVEFVSTKKFRPDDALMRMFATVGVQIGEFIVRRETQEALMRSEERFRSAFQDAHAGMALGTLDTRFLAVNRALCEMLGYAEGELVGRTSVSITHPADIPATREQAHRIASGGAERIEMEKRFVRKDGNTVWAIVRARRHRGVGGNPDLLVSHFLDITERKQVERELALAEERYRLALEGAQLGSWDTNLRTGEATVDTRYLEMLGYLPGEVETRVADWSSHLHPEDADRAVAAFDAHLRGETGVFEAEYRMRHKAGGWVWILDRGRVTERDANGAPLRVCGTHLDITFRKVAEQELQRERRLLEEARRREVQMGYEIQRSLLIGEVPRGLRGVEIAGYAEPSRGIDGDFYAFTRFRPDCFEVLVGDVMGKGVPAALVGAAVRTTYNQTVTELTAAGPGGKTLPAPEDIVNALHRALTPRLVELDTFVTMALYRFDLSSGRLLFVNAGHTPALLLGSDGRVERILGENVPIGALEDERYVSLSRPIAAGDSLLVYSDGITEARNVSDAEFGEERLKAFLQSLALSDVPVRTALQALRKRVRDFVGERLMPDDQTAVFVGLRGPFPTIAEPVTPAEEVLELPWDLAQLEPLRLCVTAAAAGLAPERAQALVLASFEAATNVVRHVAPASADARLECRVRRERDRVTVELWYVGLQFEPETPTLPDPAVAEGGFGLYIIANAVSEVRYEEPVLDVCCTRLLQRADASAAT